ncbi:hypothetical protein PQ469_24415 [Mucilaginibacter sp. KACC 22773]|uniref:hypothetical protein n=1 Tax=Mucilaginibacter sp. KACC 22773 TaxID=3025671 RepID=UPI002365E705|nr:hypothetical protein [Mucilaginibacter sp. KACC 22773]WDF77031.1 hypothetical protein PQ469_24415 [Mucilaginibacter sp. KACC 22773]
MDLNRTSLNGDNRAKAGNRMNHLLTGLGIPLEVQAFFHAGNELSFSYGDQFERFGSGYHIVPSTQNLWVAGLPHATHLIITYSVMEAMAFITLNRHRFTRLEQLAFVAIGNRLHTEQGDWLRQHFPGRKVILVFGKDLIGHITDIKLTAAIKNIPIRILYREPVIHIHHGDHLRAFIPEQISLHTFQEAFGIRPRFRTAKAAGSPTFLEQLKHDTER